MLNFSFSFRSDISPLLHLGKFARETLPWVTALTTQVINREWNNVTRTKIRHQGEGYESTINQPCCPYIPPSFTRLCRHYKTKQYDSALHHSKVLLNPSEGEANTGVITRTTTQTLSIHKIHNLLLVPNIPRLKFHLTWFGEKIGKTLKLYLIEFDSCRRGNVYAWFLGFDFYSSRLLDLVGHEVRRMFLLCVFNERMHVGSEIARIQT